MLLLYLCVVVCEFFYNRPLNSTSHLDQTIYPDHSDVGVVASFIWFEELCDYCFYKWEVSYVSNASLYTTFLLFTRQSTPNYAEITLNNVHNLYKNGFNSSLNTKIVIHGWLDNGTNFFSEEIRNAYLQNEDVNLVAVNWPDLSGEMYPLAQSAVVPVGQFTARFVDFLVKKAHVPPDSIHLVGHSLGAHIAGVVGEHVTFGNLSRVSGLDPASPLFGTDPSGRLDPTDAMFVDIIHTTGNYLGYFNPCGHVDFYPNGGTSIQPGCGMDLLFCSHRRAYKYFAESISSLGFVSTACSSWDNYKDGECIGNKRAVMGENTPQSTRGTYFLQTNSDSPFAKWNSSVKTDLTLQTKK